MKKAILNTYLVWKNVIVRNKLKAIILRLIYLVYLTIHGLIFDIYTNDDSKTSSTYFLTRIIWKNIVVLWKESSFWQKKTCNAFLSRMWLKQEPITATKILSYATLEMIYKQQTRPKRPWKVAKPLPTPWKKALAIFPS